MLLGQTVQTRIAGQPKHRNQPCRRHQIRLVEHRRNRPRPVRQLHLTDALRARRSGPRQVPISQPARASASYGTPNPPSRSVDPGLMGSGRAPVQRATPDRNRPTARRSDRASAAAQISYLKATDLRALHDEVVGHRLLELAEADRREDDALDLGSDPASDRIRPLAELADHA
jgi:hypothetical protein